jgi:hypothetical protein
MDNHSKLSKLCRRLVTWLVILFIIGILPIWLIYPLGAFVHVLWYATFILAIIVAIVGTYTYFEYKKDRNGLLSIILGVILIILIPILYRIPFRII